MKIKLVNELTDEQDDYLFHWNEQVFPIEGEEIAWAKPKWHLLAFKDQEKPIAHVGYADFTISLGDGSVLKVVGVGDVVVRPEFQGQNIPSQLFDRLHNSAHANSLSSLFTLLCPKRLGTYYQRHGYSEFKHPFTFLQDRRPSSNSKFIFMHHGAMLSTNKIHINSEPW